MAILCCLTLWNTWTDYVTVLREAQTKRDSQARIDETNPASYFRSIGRFLTHIVAKCVAFPHRVPVE